MKRILAIVLFAVGLTAAIVACGGGGDDAASADKLTIVGAGS